MHAEYVAEMVRQMLYERFGDDAYAKGYRVYTTITKACTRRKPTRPSAEA